MYRPAARTRVRSPIDLPAGVPALPFRLVLDDPNVAQVPLHCLEVVRNVPGKRLVCRGSWQGRAVYAKLYLHPRLALRQQRREVRGLRAIAERGLATPELLHAGLAAGGRVAVIVLAAVVGAKTLRVAWQAARDDDDRRAELVRRMALLLARHHGSGLVQRDLHLGNFLLADDQILTLDGSAVRLCKRALSVRRSIDNLARYLAEHAPRYDHLAAFALRAYCAQRGWQGAAAWVARLRRRIGRWRDRRRRAYLRKVFRSSTEFAVNRDWRRLSIHRRRYDSMSLAGLLCDPDASLHARGAQLIKAGNTCTVWVVPVDGRQLVIKRFNIKGWCHGLQRAMRRTRAAVCWRNVHRLRFYEIPTATPVAMIEERTGPLRGRAFFITERLPGVRGDDYFFHGAEGGLCDRAAAQAVVACLAGLAQCRISHGDLKASNILVDGEQAALVDLDAMREHGSAIRARYGQRRDLRRFLRNWERCPPVYALFAGLIAEAFAGGTPLAVLRRGVRRGGVWAVSRE